MSNIEIKHLFRNNRLPENDIKLLYFFLYLPLGLILCVLRSILIFGLFILGHIISDTPITHKFVKKIASLALGVSVTIENPKTKENVEVYISNNVSVFDQLAVTFATSAVSPGTKMFLERMLGLNTYYFGSISDFETFKKNISQFLAEKKIPIHFAPEGKSTNGKALIKFKSYPFQFTTKVQPICIIVERPFLDMAVTTVGSSFFSDVFFFLFSPLTNYKLKFLSPVERKNFSDSEFVEIVRKSIATALKVELTDYTANDLIEWEKRKLAEEQQTLQAGNSSRSVLNTDLRHMTTQVREVLPHVPFTAIYNDLYVTRNVDNTITNILEGRVHFIPDTNPKQTGSNQPSTSTDSSSVTVKSSNLNSSLLFNTAASSFGKSASERTKSFLERKEQLIANARKRYAEKHNVNLLL